MKALLNAMTVLACLPTNQGVASIPSDPPLLAALSTPNADTVPADLYHPWVGASAFNQSVDQQPWLSGISNSEQSAIDAAFCDDVASLLPQSPIIVPCDQEWSIPLLTEVIERCPVTSVKIDGLTDAVLYDKTSGSLLTFADTRPSKIVLDIEVTLAQDNNTPTFRTSLVVEKRRESRINGRRLTSCTCAELVLDNNIPSGGLLPVSYPRDNTTKSTNALLRLKRDTTCQEASEFHGSFTAVYKNGGTTPISTPSWLTIDSNSVGLWIFVHYQTDRCDAIGSYQIMADFSSTDCPPVTYPSLQYQNWQFNLVVQGVITATPSFTFNSSYVNQVSQTTTITFPTFTISPSDCSATGTVMITGSPSLPACVTYTQSALTATGCDYTVAGTYTVSFTYSLTSPLSVPITNYSTSFTLQISCATTVISPAPRVLSADYIIGDAATTGAITYTLTPFCGQNPKLTIFSQSEPLDLLTLGKNDYSALTNDYFYLGSHSYTIVATDFYNSALTNSELSLTIVVKCRVLVTPQTIADFTHILATSAPITWPGNTPISTPSLSASPIECFTTETYQFVNLDASPQAQPAWISNQEVTATEEALDGMTYSFEAQISLDLHPYAFYDQATKIGFKITLKSCTLKSITPQSLAFSLTYYLDGSQENRSLPSYTITPATCGYTYSVVLQRTDSDTQIPTFIINQVTSQNIGVQSSNQAVAGTYNFRLKATVDGNTLADSSYAFQIMMCALTQIVASPVSEIVYDLANPGTQSVTLTFSNSPTVPTECKPTFTLSMQETFNGSTQQPAYASLSGHTVSLISTSDYNLIGNHLISVAITPTKPVLTASPDLTFNIKFVCTVTTTVPTISNIEFPISGSFYAANTITVPTFTFAPAACVSSYTWTQATNPTAGFVTNTSTDITIDTPLESNIGLYTITVTAVPEPVSFLLLPTNHSTSFQVNVYKPCTITSINPVSQIASPINRLLKDPNPTLVQVPAFVILPDECATNMNLYLYESTTQKAYFYQATSAAWADSTNKAFVSLTDLRFYNNLNTQAATRSFRIFAEVVSTPLIQGMKTDLAQELLFNLNLICTIDDIIVTNPQTDYCHVMHESTYAATSLVQPTATLSPADCPGAAVSFTLVETPNSINYDTNYITTAGGFKVDTQNNAYIGLKTYAWVASVPTTTTLIGKSVQTAINISIIGCLTTPMQPSPAGPGTFIYEINPLTVAAQTYSLPSYATAPCDYAYSILIERTDNPSSPIPFSWSATSSQITYSGTVNTSLAGVQTYKITATQTYMCPSQAQLTNSSYTFSFILACRVTQLTPIATMADIAEKINDQIIKTHPIPQFTSTPSDCSATYTLSLEYLINGVVQPLPGFLSIDNATKELKIDLSAPSPPLGTYDLQIKATADTTQTVIGGFQAQPLTFKLVLTCDVTPTPPSMSDIIYPIAGSFHQAPLTVLVSPFTFSPSYCVTSYTWSLASSPDASSFVTQVGIPATSISINTADQLNIAVYTVTVTAIPSDAAYLYLLKPAQVQFVLTVQDICTIIDITPQVQVAGPYQYILKNQSPSSFTLPQFNISPPACSTTMVYKLYETTLGADPTAVIATFDAKTLVKTTNDNLISLESGTSLVFSHNSNLDAKSRTFELSAQVDSTPDIEGMVSATRMQFTVNLVCTIDSITITNPANYYCHGALEQVYTKTPLQEPTWTITPTDCPGATPVLSLVNADNGDSAYDQTYIKLNGSIYEIDTQSSLSIGVKNYSWIVTIHPTSTIAGLTQRSDIQIMIRGCLSTQMIPSSPGPDAFTYEVDPTNAVQQIFSLPSYLFSSNQCLNPYEISIVRTDTSSSIPFTWSTTSGQISYSTTDTSLVEVQNYRIDSTQTCTCQSQVSPLTDSSFVFSFTIKCRITQLTPTAAISKIQESIFDQYPKTYEVPLFAITPSDCGATYQLQLEYWLNGIKQVNLPSFIALDGTIPNQLNTNLSDPYATLGSYKFRILATSQTTATVIGGVTSSIEFDFIRHDKCEQIQLITPLPVQQTYTIDSAPINLPFPQYQLTPVSCTYNFQYQATLVAKVPDLVKGQSAPFNKQNQNLPSFFSWDPVAGIVIKGSEYSESWNSYLIKITAIDDRTGLFDENFALNVTTVVDCINGVEFTSVLPIPSTFEYKIAQPALAYTFDELSDLKSLKASVPSVCGPLIYRLNSTDQQSTAVNLVPDFLDYKQTTRHFDLSTQLTSKAGTYYLLLDVFYAWFEALPQAFHLKKLITLTLIDTNAKLSFNTTTAQVVQANSTLEAPAPQLTVSNSTSEKEEQKGATQTNQPLQSLDAASLLAKLLEQLPQPPKPKTNQKVELRFAQVYLKDLDQSGKITLQMMEEVNLTNEGQKIDADMLSITFHKKSDEDLKMTGWDLVSYTKTQIQIQLNFNAPLLVSTGQVFDQVEIFLSKRLFLPVNEPYKLVPIENPPEKMEMSFFKDLPMQMPSQKEFQKFESVQKTVGKSATATMALSMTAQVALKGVMKRLWFYFNTVQLASTFTEFNLVKTPANVSMVKKSYDSIIHVKLIPDELMTKVKALFGIKTPIKNPEETDSEPSDSTSEPTHRKLSELSPKQIRNNRIALGVVLLLIIISFAVVIILRRRIWAKLPLTVKNLLRSLPQMFIWNGVIRSLLELFYPTTLLAMSAAAANLHNKSKLAIPLAKIGFFVGFLGVTAIHIESKKEVIDTAEYKSKYGAYFTNVETYIKPRAVHYSTIFLARRLTIALTIVCLKGSGVLQSLVAVYSSLAMLSWLILVMPLDTKSKNYLEMTNEFLVTILGYYGFLFTDYVGNPIQRYIFGYVYIGLLAAGLFFNVINLLHSSITDFIHWWKVTRHRKKIKKPVEQTQQPEQSPDLHNGRKSIFAKLFEGEQLSEGDFPQVNEQSSSVINYEEMLSRKYENQPVNLADQPKLITAEIIDRYYRNKNAPQPFMFGANQLQDQSEPDDRKTQQTWIGMRQNNSDASNDSFTREPHADFRSRNNKVGVLQSNKMDEIFETIIKLQNKAQAELEASMPPTFAYDAKKRRRQREEEEEEKVEIVEGRLEFRRVRSPKKTKQVLVIESDSESAPEIPIKIGSSYKEIDAYYDNLMADLDKEKTRKRPIEDDGLESSGRQGKRKSKSLERTLSRPKKLAPRVTQPFDPREESYRMRQREALRVSNLESSESDN